MTDTNKSPIRLRKRKLLNGNISLYLDIYHKDGKRDYEFLKLYLIPEKTRADKEKNKAQAESTVHMLNWAIRSVKFLGVEFD